MAIEIFPAARTRIKEIRRYTKNLWGKEQADKYLRGIGLAISKLPDQAHLWRLVDPTDDEALKGIFFMRYQRHYIFFRTFAQRGIGVISVLHESMDIPSRLKEERDKI